MISVQGDKNNRHSPEVIVQIGAQRGFVDASFSSQLVFERALIRKLMHVFRDWG